MFGPLIGSLYRRSFQKHPSTDREYWGKYEGLFSVVFNVILFGIKMTVGLLSGSIAVMADAVHTLSDVGSSIGVFFGFKMAYRPPDCEHPYGHGRAEHIATLGVSFLLFITGFEFIKSSIRSIASGKDVESSLVFISAIAGSILLKEFMAQVSFYLGKRIRSETLKADGWHHRSDALSSVLVLFTFIIPGIDGYLGVGVALFILWSGFDIARRAVSMLIGEQPSREMLEQLKKFVRSFDFVEGLHDIIINNYEGLTILSLHVELDSRLSFEKAHYYSEMIEEKLDETFNVKSVVHIDPVDKQDPFLKEVNKSLAELLEQFDYVDSFHDLRKIGVKRVNIILDLSTKRAISRREEEMIRTFLLEKLRALFPSIKNVIIKVEPLFSY
ncbi:MAG TPA: cation diffusion facilitator family transporter [Candidatus Mcinerneyibacteriales bacterium]|nr:cation diffusion facilitator family transporter [Candidatus Mcinerneyibacteriales bacterium]